MNDSSADLNVFNIIVISNKIIYRIKSKAFIFNNQIYAICRTHATCVSQCVCVCGRCANRVPKTNKSQFNLTPALPIDKSQAEKTRPHKTSPTMLTSNQSQRIPDLAPQNKPRKNQSQRSQENQTSTRQAPQSVDKWPKPKRQRKPDLHKTSHYLDKTQRQNAIGTAHQTRLAAVDLTVRAKCSCKF